MCSTPMGAVRAACSHGRGSPHPHSSAVTPGGIPVQGRSSCMIFLGFFPRLTTMPNHDLSQREIPWHALLNCPEARVLDACEERELLVELVDCKNRILASSPVPNSDWANSTNDTSFQQRVRELASCPAGSMPSPTRSGRWRALPAATVEARPCECAGRPCGQALSQGGAFLRPT